MKIKTLEGFDTELNRNKLDSLKIRLRGPVLLPGDVGYEDSRTVWNAMIDRKPAFVVRCIGITDVIECLKFAKEHNLLLCMKGGGHNIAGLAVTDGAMML
ncbi:MAG: FAD-binding protein, partial [Acidobacteriota bacterium]